MSIRGEMTVQFEVVNPATLELKKSKVNYTVYVHTVRKVSLYVADYAKAKSSI